MSFQESGISSMSSQSTNSQQTQPKPVVTIRVCSGADCRVDGSTDCLRMIQNQCKQKLATLGRSNDDSSSQQQQQQQQLRDQIKIKSVQCLGPCGDGPNVVLNLSLQGGENDDRFGKRVVNRELQDILKETNQKGSGGGPKSLVPAEPFGANTSGVYQVRTTQNAATIVNLAVQTLSKEGGVGEEAPLRSLIEDESKMSSKNEHVTVTRQWYDRPRNERLVLQRFMHVSILFGLGSKYNDEGGVLPSSAWIIAGILWILSNLIMKENLLEQGWNKINRKKR